MTLFDGKDGSFYVQVVKGQCEIANKYQNLIRKAASKQDTIGWTNMLEGKMAKIWEHAQDKYYQSIPKRQRKGYIWAKHIIVFMYDITQGMWTHQNDKLYENQQSQMSTKKRN